MIFGSQKFKKTWKFNMSMVRFGFPELSTLAKWSPKKSRKFPGGFSLKNPIFREIIEKVRARGGLKFSVHCGISVNSNTNGRAPNGDIESSLRPNPTLTFSMLRFLFDDNNHEHLNSWKRFRKSWKQAPLKPCPCGSSGDGASFLLSWSPVRPSPGTPVRQSSKNFQSGEFRLIALERIF